MNIIYNIAILLLLQCSLTFNDGLKLPKTCAIHDSIQLKKSDKPYAENLVFTSADGGQTWQNISKGLPKPVQDNYGIDRNDFFADNNGLYLTAGNGLYQCKPISTAPFWTKGNFPDKHNSIAPGKAGIFAYNYWGGGIFQKTNGTNVWSPVFTNFKEKQIRSIFETAGGAIFIGTDGGLFKSTNSGKTWKLVHVGGLMGKLVEQNGTLVATSMNGIIQSADSGEHWNLVISEGGVGIDVANIKGGFAAITFNTQSNTRRVRTSYDGGKTWQPIDAGLSGQASITPVDKPFSQIILNDSVWHPTNTRLPDQAFITSIIQVGENFFCGHPDGIYKSSDKGKTWKRILCPMDGKVFNLAVSGKVIYAVLVDRGC